MEDITPLYLKREAIENLYKKLNLPTLGPYSQDWEYELADSSRIIEFLLFYEKHLLTNDEKYALMALIISSYDDSLSEGNTQENVWNKIRINLLKDFKLHKNTISYWALEENELEDCFSVTPLMREILKNINR